jgi:hypothetical protein
VADARAPAERGARDRDLIAVREGGSATTRALTVIRRCGICAQFDAKVAAGGQFSDFNPSAIFGGRTVVHHRERLPQATVDWFVFYQGEIQLSIG